MVERGGFDVGIHAARGQQRRHGRCKAQRLAGVGKIERLDAEPVARQHDTAAVAFPDCECEHAMEAFDAARSPRVIGLQDDLGIAGGEEAIAAILQLGAQGTKIVNAAVENDGQAEIGVDHRLLGRLGEVENAQPAMAEGNVALREKTPGVRSA